MSELNTVDKVNEYKVFLASRAKLNYYKRKDEGRLKKNLIPKEDHKKRGPKQTKQRDEQPQEPKTKGRRPIIYNQNSNIPEYLIKLTSTIKEKEFNVIAIYE